MVWLLAALVAVAMALGTERLGRPLTDEEKKELGALLREHDYPGARLVALRFAYRLTRNRARAEDLMGRVDLRLVRLGWNRAEVSLVRCLCRYVWSEWTHARDETVAARRAEETFLRSETAEGETAAASLAAIGPASPPARELGSAAQEKLDALRAAFEKAGDEVNLAWLDYTLQGIDDLAEMATSSGRPVADFYAAAKRRKRAVSRLLAEQRGVPFKESE